MKLNSTLEEASQFWWDICIQTKMHSDHFPTFVLANAKWEKNKTFLYIKIEVVKLHTSWIKIKGLGINYCTVKIIFQTGENGPYADPAHGSQKMDQQLPSSDDDINDGWSLTHPC